jgi:2-polyprenyl-6-methoxyphenol hydroxylase-like FAD-dependent oxidoreductase
VRPGGHAVDLRGAGKRVAEQMGILPQVRQSRVDERGFAYVDSAGRHRSRMPADLFGGEGIVAEIEIMRGDLGRILVDAARPVAEYRFADRITALRQDDSGVEVTFARGDRRTFDLVVGADGIHSGVRKLAFGDESQFVRYLGAYNAYYTVPGKLDTDGWFLMHSLPGARMAAVRPEREAGQFKAMFSFASPPLDYDRRDVDQQKRILTERFAGAGWEVPRLLDALPTAPDFYFEPISQVHMPQWSTGRVVLLGDAGYSPSPLAGLGTTLSLVGAYLLAGELATTGGDHHTAFARYETLLRDYATQAQKLPPGGVNGFLPKSRPAIWMRDQSMRMMTRWPLKALLAGTFTKSEGITLPEYQGAVTRTMVAGQGDAARSRTGR